MKRLSDRTRSPYYDMEAAYLLGYHAGLDSRFTRAVDCCYRVPEFVWAWIRGVRDAHHDQFYRGV